MQARNEEGRGGGRKRGREEEGKEERGERGRGGGRKRGKEEEGRGGEGGGGKGTYQIMDKSCCLTQTRLQCGSINGRVLKLQAYHNTYHIILFGRGLIGRSINIGESGKDSSNPVLPVHLDRYHLCHLP